MLGCCERRWRRLEIWLIVVFGVAIVAALAEWLGDYFRWRD